MQKPLFFIICVASIAVIEATPWYKKNPTKRREEIVESDNRDATDFGVETFDVNAGDAGTESETGFKSLNRGNQNFGENKENGGDDIEQDNKQADGHGGRGFQNVPEYEGGRGFQNVPEYEGGRGSQGGRGYQGGRGDQGSRGSQGGFENSDSLGDLDGRRYPSGGNSGGRWNQNGGGHRREEDSDSEDDSYEYTKKKPKHSCRRCRINNIGNGSTNSNRVFIHEN